MPILTLARPTTLTRHADQQPDAAPALTIRLAVLDDHVAKLTGRTLLLNPTVPVEDQLWAIADAVRYLQTGHATAARPARHLHLVTGGAR